MQLYLYVHWLHGCGGEYRLRQLHYLHHGREQCYYGADGGQHQSAQQHHDERASECANRGGDQHAGRSADGGAERDHADALDSGNGNAGERWGDAAVRAECGANALDDVYDQRERVQRCERECGDAVREQVRNERDDGDDGANGNGDAGTGSTITSLTTPVVFTFSSPINPQTVNSGTVYAQQYNPAIGYVYVAGTIAVSSGNTVITFTPLAPWAPSTVANNSYVYVYVSGVTDPEGNSASTSTYFYTPVTTPVVTPLTLSSVTPANGATGVGQNAVVAVTFSHSVNPATVTGTTLALFAGDTNLGASITMSADNLTAVLTVTLPVSSTITVIATPAIADLSGNALTGNLTSQFTTGATPPSTGPSIVTMRPGSGATSVPASTVITLFANAPLNASTLTGGVHVSQNGVLVSGVVNAIGNGTSIEFVPNGSLTSGAFIEVNVDQTVTDQYGNPLTAFYGSFTVAGNATTTAPVVVATSPTYSEQGVPLNASVFVQFSQALNSATVSSSTAYLTDQNGSVVPSTTALLTSGNTIQITPSSNLTAGTSPTSTYYYINVTTGVQDASGVGLASAYQGYFYTGTGTDATPPTVLGVAPPNNQQNVGLNGLVVVTFSKPMNPITVNSTTVSLSYGTSSTVIPATISFNSTVTQATFTPTAPLPPSATITVAITNGVQDLAGNAVTAQSTTFKTATAANTVGPTITVTPPNAATNVPTNSVVVIQFSEPVNAQTVSPNYNYLYDSTSGQTIPANLTVSADGLTATLTPTGPLPVGTLISVYSSYAQDLSGNIKFLLLWVLCVLFHDVLYCGDNRPAGHRYESRKRGHERSNKYGGEFVLQ